MARNRERTGDERYAAVAAECACLNFRKASRSVTQLYDDILAPTGLRSTQFVILVAVAACGPSSIARVARELVMDASTLSRNLKPLEARGLLEREAGPTGRVRFVTLTPAGRRALADAMPLWEKAQQAFLEEFGFGQWGSFRKQLDKAVRAGRQ